MLFYFLMIRPQRREQSRRVQMLGGVKKNDRVVTIGGVYGVVANVNREADEVTLKVDETTNTKLRITLSSIARVLGDEPSDEPVKNRPTFVGRHRLICRTLQGTHSHALVREFVVCPSRAAPEPTSSMDRLPTGCGGHAGRVVLPGRLLGQELRMPDHGWKISVILFSVLASVAVLLMGPSLKLGVDLRGGVILIYEIDQRRSRPTSHSTWTSSSTPSKTA